MRYSINHGDVASEEMFRDRKKRQPNLLRFINFYNTINPLKGIDDLTPYRETLRLFLWPKILKKRGFLAG